MTGSRLQLVAEYPEEDFAEERLALYRALVRCLDPDDVCALADLVLDQNQYKRRAVLARLHDDMADVWTGAHAELVTRWVQAIPAGPYRRTLLMSRCLRHLFDVLPMNERTAVLEALSTSSWSVPRRSIYRPMRDHWNPAFMPLLVRAWERHHDAEAVPLVAAHAPPALIARDLDRLLPQLFGRSLVVLAERLAESDADRAAALSHLRRERPASYCYVLAKLGKRLTPEDAVALFRANRDDERIGLMLWSFGQMRLWDALTEICSDVTAPPT